MKLTMLGTGNALVTECYNTCFLIEDNGQVFMVDGGGGNTILRQTTRALELSGNAPLYPKNRRDIILTVAINQKAGVIDANLLLSKYGEEPLA